MLGLNETECYWRWFLISAPMCPGLWLRVEGRDDLNWMKSMEDERTIP